MHISDFDNKDLSIEEALQIPETIYSLEINCKEDTIDYQITSFINLETLIIYNCPHDLKLPDKIDQLKKLRTLIVYPPEGEILKIPEQFYPLQVNHFITSNIELKGLIHYKNLEKLRLHANNLKETITFISKNLNNLKLLELFSYGSDRKATMPPQIGSFNNLEELEINISKLSALPKEFDNLLNLKSLTLKWTGNELPEVITKLPVLEILKVSGNIRNFPESLVNMASLKELHIDFGLPYSRSLRNIPELSPVIGKLYGLTHLNLDYTAVTSLDSLTGLKSLKSLSIHYSGIKNCECIVPFQQLEELNISSTFINDISPLVNLPKLKRLNLESLDIEDISPIGKMEKLEYLNINTCVYLWDYSQILEHPTLKELEASEEILQLWNFHKKYKHEFENGLTLIKSNIPEEIEAGLAELAGKVIRLSNRGSILFLVFGMKSIDPDGCPESIYELDTILEKNIGAFSSRTLEKILKSSLIRLTDNYQAASIVLKEIVARKDKALQNIVVDHFMEYVNITMPDTDPNQVISMTY